MKKRLIAVLMTVLIAAGLVPVPASAAGTAHFKDVPAGHWACQYVERAYQDGAIVGKGGNPAAGAGIFAPDEYMTYGQFLTMLVNAFYPGELARVSREGPWYAPAIRVAVARQLNFNTLDELMGMADAPINRYNAAWILVKLLDDKSAVLPGEQERAAAAAKIADWDTLLKEEYWRYFVSSVYALGIISGVDEAGSFNGDGYITRASAAVIYTKTADKVKADGGDPKTFQVIFEGDWSAAPAGAREGLEEEFYTVYPRLWARWGTAETTRCVSVQLVPEEEIDGNAGVTYQSFDYTQYRTTAEIKIAGKYAANQPHIAAIFAHELAHAATGATTRMIKGEDRPWFFECLADYALFRYAAWADERYMWLQESYYQPEDEALRTWNYQAYADTHWFFAYLDEKYPTAPAQYGLLDSILLAMRSGQVTTDGGTAQNDPHLNALVKQVTGHDSLNALRQRYVAELDAGTWTFDGFAGYPDNYITEGLPGVPDPTYLTAGDFDLCTGAHTYGGSGQASEALAANNLVDGDLSTRWEAAKSDVKEPNKLNKGVRHAILVSLDKPVTFNTYVLYHAGSQGDSRENTKTWRVKYYDANREKWIQFDAVWGNTSDVTTRTFTPVTSKYLWLEILDPSGTGDGTVRLYELELFNK